MTWLVLTVLFAVVGTVGLGVGITGTTSTSKLSGYATTGCCIVLWLILTAAFSVHGVGTKKVGLVYNFAGVLSDETKSPGIVWTPPWSHIRTADVGIQREDFVLGPENAAVSKDQQPIYADLSLNYQVLPAQIVRLYKNVGSQWKQTLLDSRVLQDFKEVTATFTAAEITTKRDELRKETVERLQKELQPYDIGVTGFFVKNLGYTHEYRAAINAKNVQVQKALQAQAKILQSEAEAKQAIAVAEGKAKANRLQSASLTPQVLMQHAIESINPKVAIIYCPTGSLCVPNSSLAPFSSALKNGKQ